MNTKTIGKPHPVVQFLESLPAGQRIITDVLRQIVLETLPAHCKEKFIFNVPYFYGNKGICMIWPSSVPRGGIKKGVLFGLWYGNRLADAGNFLEKGKNKQFYYKIYQTADEIDETPIKSILMEALALDASWKKKS